MIKAEHLSKSYGDFEALKDLSFQIDGSSVYGFLGPNGAGKSTTMNIMTGCLSPTEGKVSINGLDIFENAKEAKKLIGYLPEQPPLYVNETPTEYLKFVGEAKGLKEPELSANIEEALDRTGLYSVKDKLIRSLSKGFRQRVGIAQAIMGDPQVIILDEPTVGLDPIQIIEIRDLIKELGREHTVILSSHILSEVQAICKKILIIAHGELIAFDTPENLENKMLSPNEISFLTEASQKEAENILSSLSFIKDLKMDEKDGYLSVTLNVQCDNIYEASRELFFSFAKNGKALLEVDLKKANLEEIFIELTDNSAVYKEEKEEE